MEVLIDLPMLLLWAGLTRMVVTMGLVKAGNRYRRRYQVIFSFSALSAG